MSAVRGDMSAVEHSPADSRGPLEELRGPFGAFSMIKNEAILLLCQTLK